jgi:nucleoid-associated protein YgaU
MTRETKIGLLVGLAFIIVIGILLSDHFTSATQPHQAALTTTIDGVLGSTRTLGPQNQDRAPLDVPAVEPSVPILVQPDAAAERRSHVEVGGARGGQRVIDVTEQPVIPAEPIITQIPDVNRQDAATLETLFRPIEQQPVTPNPIEPANTNVNTKTYTAESGDTLGKMASKAMGANNKANRDAILKANPPLAANPDKIVIGQKYNIPGQATPQPQQTTPAPVVEVERREPAPAASNSVEYLVRDGDSLSKIAREQCGSKSLSMVNQIKEMNKDVLNGSDHLKINMKLKLPPKQVASR